MPWWKSNYTKFLEAELTRQKMEKDARIRELIAEKLELVAKVEKLELLSIPGMRRLDGPKSSTNELALPASHWQQALEEHKRVEFGEEESWEQPQPTSARSSRKSGPADARKSEEP